MSPTIEREIKLRFSSAAEARTAVAALGAQLSRPRRRQQDSLLDTSDGMMQRQSLILRVRVEPGGGAITVKGPVAAASMKVREEIETPIADAEALLYILERIGFHPWFRSERDREEFSLEGLVIAIDDTPIGTFVELEGDEARITAAATRLGRSPADYVLESYRSLFILECERRGISPGNMLFADL